MTADTIQIDLNELRSALNVVLAHIEESTGPVVHLPVDYFWSVPGDELFEMNAKPSDLTVGQVSECWDWLQTQRAGNDDGTLAFHAVWLAEVLAAIGHGQLG